MTKIEWTEQTWNPIVGCSIASTGCKHCYAMALAARLERMNPELKHYRGLTKKVNGGVVWTGKINLAPEKTLLEPLSWKKPRTVFVNSMSDLFHEDVPDEWITAVFVVMMVAHEHTFQILTKRSRRMREWMTAPNRAGEMAAAIRANGLRLGWGGPLLEDALGRLAKWPWPPPNVWLGVSCERQQEADERIPDLLATPAAIRFVSLEPLLAKIHLKEKWLYPLYFAAMGPGYSDGPRVIEPALNWVVVGGESGPGARSLWVDHIRHIVRQCKDAGVPVFVKQLGARVLDRNDAGFDGCDDHEWPHELWAEGRVEFDRGEKYQGAPIRIRLKDRKGADMSEWPPELRIREWPMRNNDQAITSLFDSGRLLDGREHNDMPPVKGMRP